MTISRFRPPLAMLPAARSGAVAMEFALIVPLLSMMMFGMIKFGVAYNNRIALTDAARAAVRELAVGRESATAFTDTVARFHASAGVLRPSDVALTLSVNGMACSSDAACEAALETASGQAATLSATFPCDVAVLGIDFAPGCTLSATTSARIE